MKPKTKPWFASKTLWINVLTGLGRSARLSPECCRRSMLPTSPPGWRSATSSCGS